MHHFVTYCDSHMRLRFLQRLAAAAGWQATVMTGKPSVWLAAPHAGLAARLVRRADAPPGVAQHGNDDVNDCLECRTGELDEQRARTFDTALYGALDRLPAEITLVVSWNGRLLADMALRRLANRRRLPHLFMEIGNLPGRAFADPCGTGADALIARAPAHMAAAPHVPLPTESTDFETWRAGFIHTRLAQRVIGQQRTRPLERLFAPLDVPVSRLAGSARPQRLSLQRIRARMKTRSVSRSPGADTPPGPFYLHCMQVADDTNIRLHSDLDVHQALERAAAIAREAGKPLGVCLHPAERCQATLAAVAGWIDATDDVFLLGGNSFRWVLQAERVIVVNSTIGLEARLAGRPVTTLGRALYSDWTQADLANYIQRWLLPIDYFAADETTTHVTGLRLRLDHLVGLALEHAATHAASVGDRNGTA